MVSQNPKYCKNFERNSHWRKLSMIMVWERYCNASPKPEVLLFSLFIFSFICQLIWVRLGWNFLSWFSIQKQVNWCTTDPFSLKFCTSQHSYPVPLIDLMHWCHRAAMLEVQASAVYVLVICCWHIADNCVYTQSYIPQVGAQWEYDVCIEVYWI